MRTPHRVCWLLLVGLCLLVPDRQAVRAQAKTDLNKLSMEVAALQMLTNLGLTAAQHQALVKAAKEVTPKATKRAAGKGSAKFAKTLTDLRLALAKGDFENSDKLMTQLDEHYAKEKPKLDDFVEVSDSARRKTAEVIKMLTARQVAEYLTIYDEDLDDPLDIIMITIDEGAKLKGQAWNDLRDSVAEEVTWKLAGLDIALSKKVNDRLVLLLNKAHGLSPADLKKQRPAVETAFKAVVAVAGPTEQMKHIMEQRIAELLSNPELSKALATLAKHQKLE